MERTGGGQAVGSRQARAQVACRGKNEAEAGVASEIKKERSEKGEASSLSTKTGRHPKSWMLRQLHARRVRANVG